MKETSMVFSLSLSLLLMPLLVGQEGCEEPEPVPTGGDAEIDAFVEAERQDQQIVGLGLGIVVDGQLAYTSGFGFEDSAKGIAVDPQATRFRWASISKTLTGVAAMSAKEDFAVDLDVPIEAQYPSYVMPETYLDGDGVSTTPLPEGTFVSLRQLLGHLGGMQHYSNGLRNPTPDTLDRNNPDVNTGFEWALDYWVDGPLVEIPGTAYSYTTMGFNLAGAVIGGAIGGRLGSPLPADQIFTDYVQNEIVAAAEAPSIQPDYQWEEIPNRATGYMVVGEDQVLPDGDSDVSWKLPGGGYLSTAEDMARYCAALTDDTLLSEDGRDELWQKQVKEGGGTVNYGLGFSIGSRNGNKRVSHNGSQEKATSRLVLYPDDGLCIIILTNTRGINEFDPSLGGITNGVEDIIRDRLAAGEDPIQALLP